MNQKHNKEKVIQLGIQLFSGKGYNNVGLDEICKTTGMTKGAFYNAFESKENYLLETIYSFDQTNSARIIKMLTAKPGDKAIDLLKHFYTDMLNRQPKLNYMGCMINNMMSELGALNEKVGNATKEGFTRIIESIEQTVLQAQQEGDLTFDYTSKEIATLLHCTFYGVLTSAKSLNSNAQALHTMNILFNTLTTKK